MNIPYSKVKIHNRAWTISVVSKLDDKELGELLGKCDPALREIKIKKANARTMKDVVLHEILHALLPDFTEEQILRMETAIGAFLIEHPEFAEWFAKD